MGKEGRPRINRISRPQIGYAALMLAVAGQIEGIEVILDIWPTRSAEGNRNRIGLARIIINNEEAVMEFDRTVVRIRKCIDDKSLPRSDEDNIIIKDQQKAIAVIRTKLALPLGNRVSPLVRRGYTTVA